MKQTLRLTRELVDRLPRRTDERGPIILDDPPAGFHERIAADILARLDPSRELWVFAAGSLIWNPRCPVTERRVAHVSGWRRAFCIPDRRFRGSPGAPGLMMSLDRGGSCSGIVMRMASNDLEASLVNLLRQEPPLPPEWVEAETEDGPVQAILFAVCRGWPLYSPEPPMPELADILAGSVGHVGTMAEYLLNTLHELRRAGIHDPHLWRLQDEIAQRLERLPASGDAA